MLSLAGGAFMMGSDRHYPEESPAKRVEVGPFSIDKGPVTNAAFAQFVAATGYITLAEKAPDPKDYPGMPPEMARAANSHSASVGRDLPAQSASAAASSKAICTTG